MNKKPIHILGGMGPDASAKLYSMLISGARENFFAKKNEDYPEIILHSIPVPDFISNLEHVEIAKKQIKQHVSFTEKNPGIISIACNTAHLLLPDLISSFPYANFTSMPVKVAEEVVKQGYKRVAILGTPITLYSGIYQQELFQRGIDCILPEPEDIEIIGNILIDSVSGEFNKGKKELLRVIRGMKKKKAEAIILGCTELSLIFPKTTMLPKLDSLEILANALLKDYYQMEEI